MPDYSKNIVYLSQEQYNSLLENQSITVDGVTVTYNENDLYVTPQADPVIDVQVNGTSVVSSGVANVPKAVLNGVSGVVQIVSGNGVGISDGGNLIIASASSAAIKNGTNGYTPVAPIRQHESTFYGLAKAANTDLASDANVVVGTYPDNAKAAIQTMLGIDSLIAPTESSTMASQAYAINDLFLNDGKLYKATAAISQGAVLDSASNCQVTSIASEMVKDIQINGSSILSNGVANIPLANSSGTPGAVKLTAGQYGITKANDGYIYVVKATDEMIKTGGTIYSSDTRPLMSTQQHMSAFYGLAKAAGADMKDIANTTVGTYPDAQKAAIQHMLGTDTNLADYESDTTADQAYAIGELFMLNGKLHQATAAIAINDTFTVGTNCAVVNVADVFPHDVKVNGSSVVANGVANIPLADDTNPGTVKINDSYGFEIDSTGLLKTKAASASNIKAGSNSYRPVASNHVHEATFYGLAKAAGDTTQSASSNAVGTYTSAAKAAIHSMLGTEDLVEVGFVEEVSGTTPTITGQANYRYICGEVTTLSITPPSAGAIDVLFTSGSTATVLTLPNTVKLPSWFDYTNLDVNTTYELLISDGVYGSVMSWAT